MRWVTAAVCLLGLFYSVLSDEEADVEPSLSIMARSSVYNAGETKAIFCKGKNIVEPIEWYDRHNKKVGVRSSKNNRVYVEKTKEEKDASLVPLIIHYAEVSDSGNWTCKAGDFKDTIDILVGVKVNITNRNISIEGEEGKNIKFNCKAIGVPEPTVVWYKDNAPIVADKVKYSILANHTLMIKKLTHRDVGVYICKIRQRVLSYYTDKTVFLSVQHKPVIYNSKTQDYYDSEMYKIEEVYAILNETKNITCSALANPPPVYRWTRRENGYDDDKHPIVDPETVLTSEDGSSSVLVLRMHDVNYLGEYKCSASNNKGHDSVVFHVTQGTRPLPPDVLKLAAANVTELTFNVSCSLCNLTSEEDYGQDPEHLTVLGFSFELVKLKKDFPPDWEDAEKFAQDVLITDPAETLFKVGPLNNNTAYHVRVRSLNAAGYSDWFEVPDIAKTTAASTRIAATLLIVLVSYLIVLCH